MGNHLEDRVLCYAALALVVLDNVPSHSGIIVRDIKSLFDLAFTTHHIRAYFVRATGRQYCAADSEYYAGSRDGLRNLYYLKPDFYRCIQKAIRAETRREPAAGVKWLADRYKQDWQLRPSPMFVFKKAIKSLNRRQNKN